MCFFFSLIMRKALDKTHLAEILQDSSPVLSNTVKVNKNKASLGNCYSKGEHKNK